jgi:4'-phosphopantetheinyl transferase
VQIRSSGRVASNIDGVQTTTEGAVSFHVFAVDVHAWAASNHVAALDEQERARAERFGRTLLRQRYVGAHAALRVLLADHTGVSPARLELGRRPCPRCGGAHGRPFAVGCPWSFNLSHSGDVALIALSEAEVGVDVEQLRPLEDAASLARGVAGDDEIDHIVAEPDSTLAFFRMWVRKEAVVKATGEGVGGARSYLVTDASPSGWFLADIDVRDGYVAAVAMQSRDASAHIGAVAATWSCP